MKRIGIVADPHLIQASFWKDLNDYSLDALVVAGDLGNEAADLGAVLKDMRVVDCERFVVLGNHDWWTPNPYHTTYDFLCIKHLGEFQSSGTQWLNGRVMPLFEGLRIGGFDGWFDDPHNYPNLPTKDSHYVCAVTWQVLQARRDVQLMRMVEDTPEVLVTHFPVSPSTEKILADNGCRLLIQGHWHERGEDRTVGNMRVINPGCDNGVPRLLVKEA